MKGGEPFVVQHRKLLGSAASDRIVKSGLGLCSDARYSSTCYATVRGKEGDYVTCCNHEVEVDHLDPALIICYLYTFTFNSGFSLGIIQIVMAQESFVAVKGKPR